VLQVTGNNALGQTVYPDYQDGVVWIKVQDTSSVTIPNFQPGDSISILPLEIQGIATDISITRIEKAFPYTATIDSLINRIYAISISAPAQVDSLINALVSVSYIQYAEKVPLYHTFCTSELATLGASQTYHLNLINACNAWAINDGFNSAAEIAIIDNEFNVNHPDLAGKILSTFDFQTNSANVVGPNPAFDHGTHVAGIAGATTNNGVGVSSLGYHLKLRLVKASDNNGPPNEMAFGVPALDWVNLNWPNAKIINCSWGGPVSSIATQNLINAITSNGKIIVAAAGNNSNNVQMFPAAYNNVYAVANTNQYNQRNANSSFGTWVDISAPGTDIYSTLPNLSYGYKSGTSMAAPIVAALCGLVWSQNPIYAPQQVLDCISNTATNIDALNPGNIGELGAGRIDAAAALQCANPVFAGTVDFETIGGNVICAGDFVDFQATSPLVITSYSWQFPGGIPALSSLVSPQIQYNQPGAYAVTLTITTTLNNINTTKTKNFYIQVLGSPAFNLSDNHPVCRGNVALVHALVNAPGPHSFTYSLNGGSLQNSGVYGLEQFTLAVDTDPIAPNSVINVSQVTAGATTCSVSGPDFFLPVIDCCPNQVVDGNFSLYQGSPTFPSAFFSDQFFWQNTIPTAGGACEGTFGVDDATVSTTSYPPYLQLSDRGNSLLINGWAHGGNSAGCIAIGNNFLQNNGITSDGLGSTPIVNNFSARLWFQDNVSLAANRQYLLSFLSSSGNPSGIIGVLPLQLRLRVRNISTNQIIHEQSPFIVPFTGYGASNMWQKYACIINTNQIAGFIAGNYRLSIEQFEFFQGNYFDYLIDDITLNPFLLSNNALTSNLSGNVIPPGGSGNLTVASVLAGLTYTWQPLGGGTPVGNQLFGVSQAGVYTVTAADGNGCTATATIELFDLCNPPSVSGPAFWNLNNTNATFLINNLNNTNTVVTTAQPIFISGTFTVDQDITFFNCPNIIFDAAAQIELGNGATLRIDNSILRAACNDMWRGIIANHPTEGLIFTNSQFRDMNWGVDATDGAQINVQHCTFTDNNVGIRLVKSPAGYNTDNGSCIIRNNMFNSSGNPLLQPMSAQSRSEIGIYLERCQEVQIGFIHPTTPDPGEKNTFSNLYTGIYSVPIEQTTVSQLLRIYNNDYEDIVDDLQGAFPWPAESHIINNCNQTRRGAGIFFDGYDPVPFPGFYPGQFHTAQIHHVVDGGQFLRCHKAIVGNFINAEIRNVIVESTYMGFMFFNATAQWYRIGRTNAGNVNEDGPNLLHGVSIGMQIAGNTSTSYIHDNQIETREDPIITGFNNDVQWPVGIQMNHYVHQQNAFLIRYNTITGTGIGGRGISVTQGGAGTWIDNNVIQFSSTSTASGFGFLNQPEILGIELVYCKGSRVTENDLTGHPNFPLMLTFPDRLSSGLFMEESPELNLHCNNVDNFKAGFDVLGKCITGATRVTKNNFYDHEFPMLFRHLGNEGSLGDIGLPGFNCDNQFLAPVNNPGGFRVFRITTCPVNFSDYIYSDPINLQQVQFGETGNSSTNPLCDHQVQPCPACLYPPVCNSTLFVPLNFGTGLTQVDSLVASDSMTYSELAPGADWMNKYRLFQKLSSDSQLLFSSPMFSAFYLQEQGTAKDELGTIDFHIEQLADSLVLADSILWSSALASAKSLNEGLSANLNFEMNQKAINAIFFKYVLYGADTLNTDEVQTIESLALACPLSEGPAVLAARKLYSHYRPGIKYSDLQICNNAGINKGPQQGNNAPSLQHSAPQSGLSHALLSRSDEFKIYPNPSFGPLMVQYSFARDARMLIYDVLGREVFSIELSAMVNQIQVSLPEMAPGLYTYFVRTEGNVIHQGKIIFQ